MASKLSKLLALRVRSLRAECNWDQPTLAKHVGTSTKTISFIENATTETKLDLLEKLAAAFGITVPELLGEQGADAAKPRVTQPNPLEALKIVEAALRAAAETEVKLRRLTESLQVMALAQNDANDKSALNAVKKLIDQASAEFAPDASKSRLKAK